MYNKYIIACIMLMCMPLAYAADQTSAAAPITVGATGAAAQSIPAIGNLTLVDLTEFTEKNPLNPANGSLASRLVMGENISVSFAQIAPGARIPMHYHPGLEEVILVEGGFGIFNIGGTNYTVEAGDLLYLPVDTPSSTYALGEENLGLVSVFSPPSDGTRTYV